MFIACIVFSNTKLQFQRPLELSVTLFCVDRTQLTKFQTWAFKKKKLRTFFKRAEFFIAGMKASRDEGGEEYCWAMLQAAGRSYCGRSGSCVLEYGFQLDRLVMWIRS
jgi:hypothetical protein